MGLIQQHLPKSLTYHSDHCDKHTLAVQKLIIGGQAVCPRCEVEKENKALERQENKAYRRREKLKKYNVLFNQSLLEDQTLLDANFENYKAKHPEEIRNKQMTLEAVERIKQEQTMNVILQGKQGTGKSHLAYASLKELNRMPDMSDAHDKGVSSAFINIEAMLRKIKSSFNDRESKYTEDYFITLISSVDYLALDDLGAETGAIDTDKQASNFVQRVLYAAGTNRQGKSTFITTNVSGESLFNMYDSKLISRLFRNPKYVVFEQSTDKRMSAIPF